MAPRGGPLTSTHTLDAHPPPPTRQEHEDTHVMGEKTEALISMSGPVCATSNNGDFLRDNQDSEVLDAQILERRNGNAGRKILESADG